MKNNQNINEEEDAVEDLEEKKRKKNLRNLFFALIKQNTE